MAVASIQSSFSAGEVSPELYGEMDLKKISSACSTLRNAVVNYKGGIFSRGGLAYVGVSLQSTFLRLGTSTGAPRPIPFQFSITQGYILEFGDNYLRFVFQGGYVLEDPVAITGVSNADPTAISVGGTPFNVGDWVFAAGIGGTTQLNGNTYVVASATAGSFTLNDLNGNPVDATHFGVYTSGGSFARLYTVATPYAAVDLPYLKFAQSADVMSLTCVNPETGSEYLPYELTRLSAIDWTLEPSEFAAVIFPPTSVSSVATTSHTDNDDGRLNATFGYQVTAVDSKGNESVASVSTFCYGTDLEVNGSSNIITWNAVAGAEYYNVYRTSAANVTDATDGTVAPPPPGSIYGFVGSSYGTQYSDTASSRDLTKVPPTHQNPLARGQILAVEITSGGANLTDVAYSITTATGTGFAGFPAVVGGTLGAFPITSPGQNYSQGDSITFNGVGFATGAITFASNPSPGDTISLNGVVWTFVPAITGPNQTVIQGALTDTLTQLAAGLSTSTVPALLAASYSINATTKSLLITFKTAGVGGNAYTLASSSSNATVSGATLTGGSGSGSTGTHASGHLTFSVNPTASQTIILNGVTWTFVTSGATGTQTNIGANLAATLTQLASDLNASSNAGITPASYSATSTQLDIVYDAVGAVGNTYTLAAGTAGDTVSGPTLAGGTDGITVPAAVLLIGPDSGTYPGVVTYFQQRRFFANSLNNPDTFWATQTSRFYNFDTRIPTISTDAIEASPWTEQVNGIQWLIPMPGGLIAMTGNRAWQIIGEGSYQLNAAPITPGTVTAQPQAFNGCSATIPPIVIDYDVIYVEAIGNTTVRDLSWNFWVNIYTGSDLTILSSHLFEFRSIVQWTWARTPYKVLWASCDDGTMLSMTYLKEQEVYGWARHDTKGFIVGIASITEPPVNAVYAMVQRFPPYAPQGIYVMERLDDRLWKSVEDAYAVDSGVSNPLIAPDATLFANSISGAVTFTAGAAIFSAGAIGDVIRMGGGIATITGFTNTKAVTGTWALSPDPGPLGMPFAAAGQWTIATPVTSLSAPHLAGMNVIALADGVPVMGLTVGADGTIPLPFPASNVKAGLSFLPQLQSIYMNGQQVTQGARKMIPAVTMRVASSGQFQQGTNQPDGAAQNPPQLGPAWSQMATVNPLNATGGQSPPPTYTSPGGQPVTQLWTGDIRIVGEGAGWNSKGQVAIQQSLPLALEITAIEPEGLPGDVPEVTYANDKGSGRPPQPTPAGPRFAGIGMRI